MNNVLVLNKAYQAISTINWTDAIILWYKEKVEIISSYKNDFIHSPSFCMEKPSIIRLLHFVRPKKNVKIFKPFTRKNVYDRDEGICQYCGKTVSFTKFTIEHVNPRSMGGESNWRNCVCSCVACNSKKADRKPEHSGMKLLKKPFAPKIADSLEEFTIQKFRDMKSVLHPDWYTYLQWLKNN